MSTDSNWIRCSICHQHHFVYSWVTGQKSTSDKCANCRYILEDCNSDSCSSESVVRCPSCKHLEVVPCDEAHYYDPSFDWMCSECEHEYTVETETSISFISPKPIGVGPQWETKG